MDNVDNNQIACDVLCLLATWMGMGKQTNWNMDHLRQ